MITSASNPRYANADGSVIGLTVTFSYGGDPVENYCVAENSVEDFAKELYENAVNGDYGPIAEFDADILDVPSLFIPAPPPNPVPQQITMRQCRLQLLSDGLLDDVDTAINALPSPQKEAAQIEWEYSAVVNRNSALMAGLAPALELDDADIDQLFISAALL